MALVTFENHSEQIGILSFSDPDRLNAMGEAMSEEFAAKVSELSADPNMRVLILSGAGRAFSAGGDLDMLKSKRDLAGEENRRRMLTYYSNFLSVRDLGIPIIAAINGHAIGASLCLACACDIRIAASGAKLGFTFTRLGLHPGMGATYFIERATNASVASDLLLTARIIQAEEALTLGLISRVVETEKVRDEAIGIAQEILQGGPESVQQLLQSIRAERRSCAEALQREAAMQAVNYASAEFLEGVSAALEKRKASF